MERLVRPLHEVEVVNIYQLNGGVVKIYQLHAVVVLI